MSQYFSKEDFERYVNGNPAEQTSKMFYTDTNGEVIPVERDAKVSDVYLMNYHVKVTQLETRLNTLKKVLNTPFELMNDEDYNQIVGLVNVALSGVKRIKDMLEGDLNVKEVEIDEEDLPF